MVGDNPSSYCQDGVRSASVMLFWQHFTTTDDEYATTIQLYWRSDLTPCCWDTSKKQWKGYPGSISAPWSKRMPNSTIYIYNEFESVSLFIFLIYLVFIRMREPSCDFVNHLMKFKKWRERKNRPVFERLNYYQFQVSVNISKCKFWVNVVLSVIILFVKVALSAV